MDIHFKSLGVDETLPVSTIGVYKSTWNWKGYQSVALNSKDEIVAQLLGGYTPSFRRFPKLSFIRGPRWALRLDCLKDNKQTPIIKCEGKNLGSVRKYDGYFSNFDNSFHGRFITFGKNSGEVDSILRRIGTIDFFKIGQCKLEEFDGGQVELKVLLRKSQTSHPGLRQFWQPKETETSQSVDFMLLAAFMVRLFLYGGIGSSQILEAKTNFLHKQQ